VLSVVRDTVRAALPSLLRALVGSPRPAEFVESRPDQAPAADQATDLAYWGLFVANEGWTAFHDGILDALTRRVGWLRWWWEDYGPPRTESYGGLLEPQLQQLLAEPQVTALRITRRAATEDELEALMAGPEGQILAVMPGTRPMLYRAEVTRRRRRPRPCFMAVPSEQIRISPDAQTVAAAAGVFHDRRVRVGELVARGLDREAVLDAADSGRPDNKVARTRNRDAALAKRTPAKTDDSMREVRYVEGWFRADLDGDGVAELLYGEAVGDEPRLLRYRRDDAAPIAILCALREAHTAIGLSLHDMTGDLQETQTRVMRAILDSMMSTIFPRTVVVEGQASVADVLNTEVGAVIRATNPNAVVELGKPFVGPQALPVLEVLEAIRESRTGITRASQGLTAESLQSTTAVAVSAQVSAAQDRLEYMARVLAESGLRQAYIGMARMLVQQQDRPTAIKLRGQWIPVNLRDWEDDLTCQVNVAGRGATQERLQMLGVVLAQQKEVLQLLGPENPAVSLSMVRDTLAEMVELGLSVDGARYFRPVPADWRPPQQPPKPTPEEVLAQIEKTKAEAMIVREAAELKVKREEIYLKDDYDRDKARLDGLLKAAELRGEGVPINLEVLDQLMARDPIPPEEEPPPPAVAMPQLPPPANDNLPPQLRALLAGAGGPPGAMRPPPGGMFPPRPAGPPGAPPGLPPGVLRGPMPPPGGRQL